MSHSDNARHPKGAAIALITICMSAGLVLALPYLKGSVSVNELEKYRASQPTQAIGDLSLEITDKSNPATPAHSSNPARSSYLEINWLGLTSANPDVIGWIHVPGTNIDHAIAQAHESNPQYYLSHDVFQRESLYGCPYLDADALAQGGLTAPFPVIYGHHLINGQMFSDFAKFSNREYAQNHAEIILETPNETLTLKVIAVNIVNADEELIRTHFRDPEDLNAYLKARFAESEVKLDVSSADFYDQIFCFVTCSYGSENERTLVYAAPR